LLLPCSKSFRTSHSRLLNRGNCVIVFSFFRLLRQVPANGLRYLRWGGDGEAVQPEKW